MVLKFRRPARVSAQKARQNAASKSHLFSKLASGAKPKGDNEDGETPEEQNETPTLGEHVASASGLDQQAAVKDWLIEAEFDEKSEAKVTAEVDIIIWLQN